jgi:DNA-binding winged helix-turn-helix (wHTH) protein
MEIKELFYQGRYQELLKQTIDAKVVEVQPADLPYVIGALTFRGRMHEADHLFALNRDKFCPVSIFFARFFIGVGHCRGTNYEYSCQLFAKNLRAGGRSENGVVRFFAWQGAAFYHLFCGRYKLSFLAAQKALAAALECNFLYGKTLAADVTAHSQVIPGHISKAMGSFSDAERFARLLGDGGILEAIQSSRQIHSAMFGLDPDNDLKNLEALALEHGEEDNYSKARLLIEVCRQKVLRGDLKGGWDVLNIAGRLIYSANNRRYSIAVNLAYAYLLHLKGEPEQALNLVRNAEKELDPGVDHSIRFVLLGLEKIIFAQIKRQDPGQCPNVSSRRYEPLTLDQSRSGKAINGRVVDRTRGVFQSHRFLGDDPLGDLIDLCYTSPDEAARQIAESGYHGLFINLIDDAIGKKILYFDLVPGSIIIINKGNVHYVKNNSSSVIRSIAKELMGTEASKQGLIEKVWGYEYQPLKHDPLIYRSVSRFRQMLGKDENWLVATDSGYRFAEDVEVRIHRSVSLPKISRPKPEQPNIADGMNYRQLKIINSLAKDEFINVKGCQELFDVSEITARRDLAELSRRDVLTRIGKGRATRYKLSL